jgi:dihydrofolate reductase
LPGRKNIVITRRADFIADGCEVVASPAAALNVAGDVEEIMIIGGGQIYELFLPKASRVYLTRVHTELDGDVFFPALEHTEWRLTDDEAHPACDENEFSFDFRIYEKIDRS